MLLKTISQIAQFLFFSGFEQLKNEDNLFKCIKLTTTEYAGSNNSTKKFQIKCRYLESDKRIDRKMIKVRKNSCVMIIGELIFINSEFQIEAIHYFIYKK